LTAVTTNQPVNFYVDLLLVKYILSLLVARFFFWKWYVFKCKYEHYKLYTSH